MKKAKIMASWLVMIIVLFLSCNKKDQPKYSCDEEAHKYAVMYQATNQSISRDSLVKLERGLQFAVFRSLTPANKKRIYNEKIDLILATTDLTSAEREHLQAAKDYDDLSMYEADDNEPIPFLEEWEATAKTALGWTDNMI